MSYNPEAVPKWRARTKQRMIDSMGGCCQICGYSRCKQALELHHIDPTTKETDPYLLLVNCVAWKKIVVELRKCVLLCANCHREVHNDGIEIPDTAQRFDESYLDYKNR